MIFNDLTFENRTMLGKRALYYFPNGYGASVICGPYTYGGPEGLYELAVMHIDSICYNSGITDDVKGHLTEDKVTELLSKIEALPINTTCTHSHNY